MDTCLSFSSFKCLLSIILLCISCLHDCKSMMLRFFYWTMCQIYYNDKKFA